jgi:hypothetical protein
MARRKPADTVHLRLRFPEKLRLRIEAAATKNRQSMNAEIVERLDGSFKRDTDQDLASQVREWREENTRLFKIIDEQLEQLKRRDELLKDAYDIIEAMQTSPLVRAAMGLLPDFTKPAQENPEKGETK